MKRHWIGLVALAAASSARADDGAALAGAEAQQAYHAMVAFVATRVATRPADSVILAPGEPLQKGKFVPCGTKPLAIVIALGAAVRPEGAVPGVNHVVDEARKARVAVVFTSDTVVSPARMLDTLKLGPAVVGETLFMNDKAGGDARRYAIAAQYCVIAVAGTELADFTDKFAAEPSDDARRAIAVHSRAAGQWGKGWFVIPARPSAR